MLELIKNELNKYAGQQANLDSEEVRNKIAEDVVQVVAKALDFQVPTDESEKARFEIFRVTFTPTILHLLSSVSKELNDEESAKGIAAAYDDILATSTTRNNGTMLLALSQAIVTLLITATQQAQENQADTSEVTPIDMTDEDETPVAGV
ncbi:MAG: hypothetical protein WC666_03350 [Candidatus Paceibacterota bacterium]|jgi:hypothetical protein